MTETGVQAAELREVSEGRLTDNGLTAPLAPYLDGRPLRRYLARKNQYQQIREIDRRNRDDGDEPLPATLEQTEWCKRLVATHGSLEARRAVENGHLEVMAYMTGLTHRAVDYGQVQDLVELLDQLRRPGYLGVFVGGTDGGKTNTALVLAELAMKDDQDLHLLTNVDPLDWQDPDLQERTHVVESTSALEEAAKEYDRTIAVLDEMSTQANAQTSNYEVNDQFYPVVTHKSKWDLRLLIIGHREDGKDVAPAVRSHAKHHIEQHRDEIPDGPDVFRAEFYGERGDDGETSDLRRSLEPVPEVRAHYDPDESAPFSVGG